MSATAEATRTHFLHPGDLVCAPRGERLETLLGSCIAVILTDPRRTIGAMCHIVHASPSPAGAHDTTHADAALGGLCDLLVWHGITPQLCEAYVYGGGNMFPALVTGRHVGDGNAARVLQWLEDAGIPTLRCDVGGTRYRRLSWCVGDRLPQVTAVAV